MSSLVQFSERSLSRVGLTAVCGLACLSTLLIAISAEWPLRMIQASLTGVFVFGCIVAKPRSMNPAATIAASGLLFAGLWGSVQLGLGSTVYRYATVGATLQLFTLWAVFMLCSSLFHATTLRDRALTVLTLFATGIAVVVIAGGLLKPGFVLGLIPTTYEKLYGPFQYYNNAAAFLELALPIPLYRAIRDRHNLKALAAGLLYSAILITGSRAGSVLGTTEIVLVSSLAALRSTEGWRTLQPLKITALVAITISFSAGVLLHGRFEQEHPLAERMELNRSSLTMASEHPVLGFGLGTYPNVYPAYARFDPGRFVNHAHNDWAEWAVEGGLPLLFAMGALAFASVRPALRSGWGIGLLAVFTHAVVDYPFQRFGVAVWIIVVLAAVSTYSRNGSYASARHSLS